MKSERKKEINLCKIMRERDREIEREREKKKKRERKKDGNARIERANKYNQPSHSNLYAPKNTKFTFNSSLIHPDFCTQCN